MNKLDDFSPTDIIDSGDRYDFPYFAFDKIFNRVWNSTNNKVWYRVNEEEKKINFQVYKITEQISSQIRDNINFFMK